MSANYENVKRWRKENPEKVNEQARRYRAKHPETAQKAKHKYREENIEKIRKEDRERAITKRKNNPELERERRERWKAKKEAQLAEQAGRPRPSICEICFNADDRIVFDHCHSSGKFRGWICDRCNKTLGMVKDDVEVLAKLISYLRNYRDGQTI